jgi:hypothetical protein
MPLAGSVPAEAAMRVPAPQPQRLTIVRACDRPRRFLTHVLVLLLRDTDQSPPPPPGGLRRERDFTGDGYLAGSDRNGDPIGSNYHSCRRFTESDRDSNSAGSYGRIDNLAVRGIHDIREVATIVERGCDHLHVGVIVIVESAGRGRRTDLIGQGEDPPAVAE